MKIYLDPDQRGKVKLSVPSDDGLKTVGYGKDNAEEFTSEEVEALVAADPANRDLIQVKGSGSVPDAPDNTENNGEAGEGE